MLTDPQLYIVSLNFISGPETYPVILSLEQHCCPKIQKTSARLFREILGEKLLSEPLEAIHHNSSLPSPSQLLGKIIIKHKKLFGAVDSSPTSAPTAQSTTPSVDKDSSSACVQEVLFALIVHRKRELSDFLKTFFFTFKHTTEKPIFFLFFFSVDFKAAFFKLRTFSRRKMSLFNLLFME